MVLEPGAPTGSAMTWGDRQPFGATGADRAVASLRPQQAAMQIVGGSAGADGPPSAAAHNAQGTGPPAAGDHAREPHEADADGIQLGSTATGAHSCRAGRTAPTPPPWPAVPGCSDRGLPQTLKPIATSCRAWEARHTSTGFSGLCVQRPSKLSWPRPPSPRAVQHAARTRAYAHIRARTQHPHRTDAPTCFRPPPPPLLSAYQARPVGA
jgi:hypothetical protein